MLSDKNFNIIETIAFFLITLIGIYYGNITVFYVIYFFWFKELITTCLDFIMALRLKPDRDSKLFFAKLSLGAFLLLFIYFVFIVLIFGLLLNWGDLKSLGANYEVLLFRNWFFNINIILFTAVYIKYRLHKDNSQIVCYPFNKRHIILHISIILGGILQLAILPKLDINNAWVSIFVLIPFLLLKILFDKPVDNSSTK